MNEYNFVVENDLCEVLQDIDKKFESDDLAIAYGKQILSEMKGTGDVIISRYGMTDSDFKPVAFLNK